jgi:RNA polymerase sigma-70 factor (ECF subfamily)
MTAWADSITFPLPGQTSCPARQTLDVQTPSSIEDAEACRLAKAVGRGDEAAFQQLYDRYCGRIFRLALVLTHGDELLASETVQSVFLSAAASLLRVESEEHLWNWLARVARQRIARTWRQRQQDAVIEVAELPDRADNREPDSALEEKLDAALLKMGSEERQLVEWFYFDGLSHKQIAEQLGVTAKAVSSRLERARTRLRLLLTRTLNDET